MVYERQDCLQHSRCEDLARVTRALYLFSPLGRRKAAVFPFPVSFLRKICYFPQDLHPDLCKSLNSSL